MMIPTIPTLGLYVLFIQNVFNTCNLTESTMEGPEGVLITITNTGYILFDFEKSLKYAGGEVTEVFSGTGVVPEFEMQQRERKKNISYLRFKYMNSAMFILMSEASITSHQSFIVPPPCAPNNYAVAIKKKEGLHIRRTRDLLFPSGRNTHILCSYVIDDFIKTFNSIADVLGDCCMDICSLIYISSFNYSQHDFSSSLLIAWAAAEKIITALHTEHVGSPSKWKMDKNIKGLVDANILSGHLLSQVEEAKRARNDFAHNLQSSSSDTATAAVFSAARLIGVAIGREVRPQLQITHYM